MKQFFWAPKTDVKMMVKKIFTIVRRIFLLNLSKPVDAIKKVFYSKQSLL